MAGEWIKVEHVTPEKPEVMEMASRLGLTPEAVCGHLLRVWIWTDQQSRDGHAVRVTSVTLDSIARHAGFAQAMREVGWLGGSDGSVTFPNFDRHNSESAKKRALAADRKRRERSRSERDESVTRVEERRVEKKEPPITTLSTDKDQQLTQNEGTGGKRRTKLELTELPAPWRTIAAQITGTVEVDVLEAEFAKFRDHHVSKNSLMADWPAAWRTWLRRMGDFKPRDAGAAQRALEEGNAARTAGWQPPEETY